MACEGHSTVPGVRAQEMVLSLCLLMCCLIPSAWRGEEELSGDGCQESGVYNHVLPGRVLSPRRQVQVQGTKHIAVSSVNHLIDYSCQEFPEWGARKLDSITAQVISSHLWFNVPRDKPWLLEC